ncbi:hypothetical protein SAMN04489727_4371 [Amycolatopsis tolypomycina]|uniref:Uncharacterized protein n=1 Tax=Amycolatopsis tolypomycina TaxID=208445 RepID=A0A1H4TVS1_9PSEU|nr:hypothetical protein [Amycolatopsis tolypomycina]SEC60509.1 hypothetical protein SAMN04489727_4371 [Amycolatopsis tolypomycina]
MSELKRALEVPKWTWHCYTRHWRLVVGLSSIASIQRLIVVNWTDRIPHGLALASEVVVMAARIALVVLVWRLAMRGLTLHWRAGRAFARNHWRSLLWQAAFLGAAVLVFEVLAEHVLSQLLPESARQTYLAVLLFLKNPTVIALTFIWCIGLIRQVFRVRAAEEASRPQPSTVDH